jgi:phosphoesterase RecJ-like protein
MNEGKYYPGLSPRFGQMLAELPGRKIAVVGHARPDGDCIGSQVALARVLQTMGITVICVNPDPVPRRLEFLTGGMTFLRAEEVLPVAGDFTAVFVDCADGVRGGDRLGGAFPRPIAMVDHHISNVGFAAYNLLDTGSAATCEMLAGMCLDLGLTIDAQTAQALYTGILTDTGQFRFASTSQRCFRLAAELLALGARPSEAGYQLYERETPAKLMLLQRYLASFRFECGGRLCIGILPAGVFEETGSTAEDTEGLVDYARCMDGVDVGVLIEERADGGVKASLRAKHAGFRMDLVAAQFNGGGHACAAGLNLKNGAADFYPRLVAAITRQFAVVDAERPAQP